MMQKKKILTIFLIIFILFGMLSHNIGVLANEQIDINENTEVIDNSKNYSRAYLEYLELSDEEKSKIYAIPRKYNIPLDSIYEDTIEVKEKSSIFNLYGLRAQTNIVSAYSDELPEQFDLRDEIEIPTKNQGLYNLCWAFASMRSLETNLALNGYGEYDFSELHATYFSNGFDNFNYGGDFFKFKEYCINNFGPVLENEVPYGSSLSKSEYDYLFNLDSKAYIKKTIDFPTINKMWNTYTEEELELFRDKVKKHIMENGSVFASIYAGNIKKINNYSTIYNTTTLTDHAVSVIGWDDNFSKENFEDENGNMPNNNGAYIVLNSWGELDEIIYVSYEDIYIERDMSGVVDATTEKDEVTKVIKFEDENLYKALKKELWKNVVSFNDEILEITCVNTDMVEYLNLSNKNINNMKGIESFTNLNYLDVSNNNLETLDNISNLINLNYLDVSGNKLLDIKNISLLTKLEFVNLKNNELTNIDELSQLSNLKNQFDAVDIGRLDISNNKIQDVSCLENLIYIYEVNLSNNPITQGIDKLTNITSINLDNCNLDNDIISVLSNLNSLNSISLQNNNITDASNLKDLYLNYLNLSGNRNLKIETVPLAEELILKDCNISDISIFKDFKGNLLDLGNNLITDLTPLKDVEIYSVNLSNNSISDVSSLNKIMNLDLSGNYNLIGLESMSNTVNLTLSNCNISNLEIITKLENLKNIDLSNNNIEGLSYAINLYNLEELNLSNNQIDEIPTFLYTNKLKKLNLSNNNIQDISGILNFNKVDYIDIDLSNNKIKDISEIVSLESSNSTNAPTGFVRISHSIDLRNNEIREVPDDKPESVFLDLRNNAIEEVPENISGCKLKEQKVFSDFNFQINTDNKVVLPSIISSAYYNRYMTKTNINTNNCKIDFAKNEIIINPSEEGNGIATISIDGGNYDGTIYTINYNVNTEMEEENLEINISDEYIVEEDGEIKYINNINPGVTIGQVLEKIQVNASVTKKVYDGTTEISADEILATGMKIVISLNSQVAEYIAVVSGDINGDGQITATDLTRMKNHILEKSTLTDLALKAADLNNDGQITATELTKIKKYVLGFNIQLH